MLFDFINCDLRNSGKSLHSSKSEILRCSVEDCAVSNRGGQCSFYRISRETANGALKKISDEKLSVWLKALRLRNEVAATCKYSYVCHAHYIIGNSVVFFLMLTFDLQIKNFP